jgi:hypothetical protein
MKHVTRAQRISFVVADTIIIGIFKYHMKGMITANTRIDICDICDICDISDISDAAMAWQGG